MAAELQLIRCTSCGAGLGVAPGMAFVSCRYCGAGNRVSGFTRRAAVMPARIQAAEKEGLDALREALTKKYAPGPATWTAIFTMGIMCVGLVPLVFSQVGIAIGLDKTFGTLVMIGLTFVSIAVFFGFLLWMMLRKDPRVEASLQDVHQAVERQPAAGRCPSCGAPLQVPPLNAALECLFCRAALLASEGMLVRWVDNAEQRKQAWSQQAQQLLKQVQIRDRVQGCLSPVVYVGTIFVGTILLFVVLKVLRFVLGLD